MPLPKHKPGEDRNKFVSRCMSDPNSKKDFPDTKQRIAYCVKEAREDAKSSLISDVHDELLIANATWDDECDDRYEDAHDDKHDHEHNYFIMNMTMIMTLNMMMMIMMMIMMIMMMI